MVYKWKENGTLIYEFMPLLIKFRIFYNTLKKKTSF